MKRYILFAVNADTGKEYIYDPYCTKFNDPESLYLYLFNCINDVLDFFKCSKYNNGNNNEWGINIYSVPEDVKREDIRGNSLENLIIDIFPESESEYNVTCIDHNFHTSRTMKDKKFFIEHCSH